MGTGSGIEAQLLYFGVGTGQTAPTVGDIALEAQVARTNNNGGITDVITLASSPDWESVFERTRVFLEAEANDNLSEVGIFRNAAGAPMWTRQLLRDAAGDPTTITKTNEDQLRITYTIRAIPDLTIAQQVINIEGVDITVSDRVASLHRPNAELHSAARWFSLFSSSDFSGAAMESNVFPALGASPDASTGRDTNTGEARLAYTAGTFYRDYRLEWGAGVANGFATGVGSVVFGYRGNVYFESNYMTTFDPKLNKTDLKKLIYTGRVHFNRL